MRDWWRDHSRMHIKELDIARAKLDMASDAYEGLLVASISWYGAAMKLSYDTRAMGVDAACRIVQRSFQTSTSILVWSSQRPSRNHNTLQKSAKPDQKGTEKKNKRGPRAKARCCWEVTATVLQRMFQAARTVQRKNGAPRFQI